MKFVTRLFLLISLSSPALVQANGCDFTKTLFDNGQYTEAYNLAKTHAQYGDICAKFYLGVIYYNGYGIKKADTTKGHKLIMEGVFKGYKPAVEYFQTME